MFLKIFILVCKNGHVYCGAPDISYISCMSCISEQLLFESIQGAITEYCGQVTSEHCLQLWRPSPRAGHWQVQCLVRGRFSEVLPSPSPHVTEEVPGAAASFARAVVPLIEAPPWPLSPGTGVWCQGLGLWIWGETSTQTCQLPLTFNPGATRHQGLPESLLTLNFWEKNG